MHATAVTIILGLAVVAGGAAAWASQDTVSQKLEKMTAGRTAGAPISCVPKSPRTRIEILDSSAVAVFDSAKRYNISLVSGDCSFLKPGRQLVMEGTPRICAGDTFLVVAADSGIQYGSCRWGQFVSYVRTNR
jgi:hypothetical protein